MKLKQFQQKYEVSTKNFFTYILTENGDVYISKTSYYKVNSKTSRTIRKQTIYRRLYLHLILIFYIASSQFNITLGREYKPVSAFWNVSTATLLGSDVNAASISSIFRSAAPSSSILTWKMQSTSEGQVWCVRWVSMHTTCLGWNWDSVRCRARDTNVHCQENMPHIPHSSQKPM